MKKPLSSPRLPRELLAPLTRCLGSVEGVFVVGGCLRDLAMGRPPADWDIAVTGDPQPVARALAALAGNRAVRIGKGDRFVYRVVVDKRLFDIAAAEGKDMAMDLARRDFTINAMAMDAASGTLFDPHGGMADLVSATVRMVTPGAFDADPLRMLRAFRLSAELGFGIETGTAARISAEAVKIGQIAGERICSELFKFFQAPRSNRALGQMERCGLLGRIFPELPPLSHCIQGPPHDKDALAHTLAAYANLEMLFIENARPLFGDSGPALGDALGPKRQGLLKCAILLHDIGKPAVSKTGPHGRIRFHGHGRVGADMADAAARRLAFSNDQRRHITFIIGHHLRPLSLFLARQRQELTQRGIARFFRACHPLVPDLFLHAAADMAAKAWDKETARAFSEFARQMVEKDLPVFVARARAPALISGQDLIDVLGLVPSPDFRRILDTVEEARLAGKIKTRTQALAMARNLQSIS